MELGNQSEFLGVMPLHEMLPTFFTHDGGDTSKWRLKGHAGQRFWAWLATWAIVIKKPSDLGFPDDGYDLPPIQYVDHTVESPPGEYSLFPDAGVGLLGRNRARRESIKSRVEKCVQIVNGNDEQWIAWCHLNDESKLMAAGIDGAVEIKGADSIKHKESAVAGFLAGEIRVIVTKPSIMGFGLNLQVCHNMAFVGISDSWESFYQATRRCWRFGQKNQVNVHVIVAEAEGAVLRNLQRKEEQAAIMTASMIEEVKLNMKISTETDGKGRIEHTTGMDSGENWTLYMGDCVDVTSGMDDESIDYTIFSPPFASLYTYSASNRDMGNSSDDQQFMEHFSFLVDALYRITKPGRLVSFHCMDLPTLKSVHGHIGIRDFRGELIRVFEARGWYLHSQVTIWKDPVTAMHRTKALGLKQATILKDSSMSRQGIPDYLVTMRKPGGNIEPISHTPENFPVSRWQLWASPVWMDIKPSDTINCKLPRDPEDERHICPLQLGVIERGIGLWSNPGDLVFSPFAGIGSEGHQALKMGRRFVGAELKPAYFSQAVKNLMDTKKDTGNLFDVANIQVEQ